MRGFFVGSDSLGTRGWIRSQGVALGEGSKKLNDAKAEMPIALVVGILIDSMATRSISISRDAELLKAVDRELQQSDSAHQNRSAAMSEALDLWLQKRQLLALQGAYAKLASLKGDDLETALRDAAAMGQQNLDSLHG